VSEMAVSENTGEMRSVLVPDREEMRQMAPLFFHAPEAFGLTGRCCALVKVLVAGEFHIALNTGNNPVHSLSADSADRIAAYRKYWSAMKFEII
jgi:hypothetical protein